MADKYCMKAGQPLSPRDREFFSLVAQAIFTNPFSDERVAVDVRLAGLPGPLDDTAAQERHALFMPRVSARLEELEQLGSGKIESFSGEDRKVVEYAWLFYFFHRHIDDFDALIQRQLAAGDEPVTVPFGGDLLAALRRKGFSKKDALRFMALFFQLRRAYYFIAKSLVGRSRSMKKLRFGLWNNVFTHDIGLYERHLWDSMEDFSTLLLGETGTGKGAAAAAIGRSGCIPFNEKKNTFEESFTRTFLAINLSQYPESLIESELFGHRKGAFTGAVDNHEGVFSRSSPHGALFVDEIGEVSSTVQVKLLQVIQERTFSPVGSHAKQRFEGRVIAATNRPLEQARAEGAFRDDFFYRLSSDVIIVPPLRQRLAEDRGELDDLLVLLTQRIAGEASPQVIDRVKDALDRNISPDYDWPGNVRELEQAVRRILLTGVYLGEVSRAGQDAMSQLIAGIESGALTARQLMSAYCKLLYERYGNYEEVARRTRVDRRTAKKHIEADDAENVREDAKNVREDANTGPGKE